MSIGLLLSLVFLVLHLVGVDPMSTWAWWQIFLPLIIEFGLYLLGLLFFIIFGGGIAGVIAFKERRRRKHYTRR